MKIDIVSEIDFKTARSGGKGGQNVNKIESMVEGRWDINASNLVPEYQKQLLAQKLHHRITSTGHLLVKSQVDRTQLGNKSLVISKMNELVNQALIKKVARIATKPPKVVNEKRIETKKRNAFNKSGRKKINWRDL